MSGFGKLFSGLYEGSMLGAGVHVFALWPYCISRSDAHGNVEVNPRLAAVVLGCSIPEVESALDYLMRPDPESRSKEEDGRRLIREGQFAYRIVNYAKYREARDADARREYQREWDRAHRPSGHTRWSGPTQSDTVRQIPTNPTKAEAEAEAEAEKSRGASAPLPPPTRVRFAPPTEDEWIAYCTQKWPDWSRNDIIAAHGHYDGLGWAKVKNWKGCAKTCYHRQASRPAPRQGRPAPTLIGAHPPGPKLREIDEDSPEEIVEIVSKLRRREATDAEIATLDAWQRGTDAH